MFKMNLSLRLPQATRVRDGGIAERPVGPGWAVALALLSWLVVAIAFVSSKVPCAWQLRTWRKRTDGRADR